MAHPIRLLLALAAAVALIAGAALMVADTATAQTSSAQTRAVQAEPAKPRLQPQKPRVQVPNVQIRPTPAEQGDEAAADSGCFSGLVQSLRVGADGEISEMVLFSRSNTMKPRFRGCGATMAELPFLWDLYREKDLLAEFCYRDGCLTAVNLIY